MVAIVAQRYRWPLLAIGAAWLVAIWAEVSGVAVSFHHDHLAAGSLPLWAGALLLLAAWQVMTTAMMLPSSLPLIRMYTVASRGKPERLEGILLFLGAYFAVWTGFALVAFFGDAGLHRLVAAWPWLAERPQLILAATFGLAAIYQVTPLKDACLRACRHPGAYLLRFYRSGAAGGLKLGLGHAMFCLGCCWALMIVMFAAGVAHLSWMALLALIMLIEKTFPSGDRLVVPVGVIFGLLSLTALIAPALLPLA
jgi:predicted metal-binding membrane protein